MLHYILPYHTILDHTIVYYTIPPYYTGPELGDLLFGSSQGSGLMTALYLQQRQSRPLLADSFGGCAVPAGHAVSAAASLLSSKVYVGALIWGSSACTCASYQVCIHIYIIYM